MHSTIINAKTIATISVASPFLVFSISDVAIHAIKHGRVLALMQSVRRSIETTINLPMNYGRVQLSAAMVLHSSAGNFQCTQNENK